MSITIPATGAGDVAPVIATESLGGAQYQLVKLIDGTTGVSSPIGILNNPFSVEGDAYHGSLDAATAAPVKIGGQAVTSAFPTAVASGTRVNALFDKVGRQVTALWAPLALNINKWSDFAGPQSGSVVWSAGANNRVCVTDLRVMAGSGTAGIVTVFYARSGSTIMPTVGSGLCLFKGEMAPSSTVKPGAIMQFPYPVVGEVNDAVRIAVSTSMQIYVQIGGFEAP